MKKIIGDVLKELREESGFTQEQLAFKSDLDRTYISLLERGLRMPTVITLFRLSSALDIQPESFVKKIRITIEDNS